MKARKRVRLIHVKAAEGKETAALLRKAGYQVAFEPVTPALLKKLRDKPPDALVIDLSRTPSHGRDVAVAVRHWKATRHVPILFVDGDPEKVSRIEKLVPDAVYTPASRLRSALKRAIAHPPQEPVKTASVLAGYSGTPLPKKLGIKPGFTVGLVGAPSDFSRTLGRLPQGATLRQPAGGRCDLLMWFPASTNELERKVERMGAATGPGGIWIAWPKQSSGVETDLTQTAVRKAGLDHGLVDYKICAIDATWSGLKFARRKP
jgi:CheY-like chemotaxis protein